jgi:hypothetical protein
MLIGRPATPIAANRPFRKAFPCEAKTKGIQRFIGSEKLFLTGSLAQLQERRKCRSLLRCNSG